MTEESEQEPSAVFGIGVMTVTILVILSMPLIVEWVAEFGKWINNLVV